jgi:hypothetical protein
MIAITDRKWIADLGAMMCRNIESRVVVGFYPKEKTFEAKLQDMSVELMKSWADLPNGEGCIRQAVEVFLRTWFETDIEKGGTAKDRG